MDYHGAIPYKEVHEIYQKADLGLFASSCENMPNILIENMAAGLPIACSNRGPMPEVLQEAGLYFNPESYSEIADILQQMIASPELRMNLATASYSLVKKYNWKRCAEETFQFLIKVAKSYDQTKN